MVYSQNKDYCHSSGDNSGSCRGRLYSNLIVSLKVLTCIFVFSWAQLVHAEFVFGFNKLTSDPTSNANELGHLCGRFGNKTCEMDSPGTPDGESFNATDWVQEIVTIGTEKYWHNVVGDPADGFALEYYTKFGSTNPDFATSQGPWLAELNKSTTIVGDGAGFIPSENLDTGFNRNTRDCFGLMGVGCNPLGHNKYVQANGYQNPKQVAMKMVLSDAETSMVFEKSEIAEKPKITQTVNSQGMTLQFKADMSNGNYDAFGSQLTVSSNFSAIDVFVNTLTFTDPEADDGEFDYATDVEAGKADLNAGQFIFTAGKGWAADRPNIRFRDVVADFATWNMGNGRIYDKGTYTYGVSGDGSFELDEIDWSGYMDATQNPCGGTPWCDGGGFVVPMPN